LESGLSLGQQIKIPLNSSNFFQSGNAAADEIFVPVYHKVKDKEGLYRVAFNHNDLPLETLKQWNNIKGDAVKNGTKLIVGYLKVKTELSGLAKNGIGTTIGSTAAATVKAEEKKAAAPEITNLPAEKKETAKAEKKENEKQKEGNDPKSKKTASEKSTGENGFKNLYESQVTNSETVETTGTAGVFKSTSGWSDKKYYCLHNSAAAGMIVKITNPANGKSVFAKVLDLMPDIKQNEGLLICISNAAAEALGTTEGNFNCSINYSK